MGHLAAVVVTVLVIALLVSSLAGDRSAENIICPNPNCGYRGPGAKDGGSSGCLPLRDAGPLTAPRKGPPSPETMSCPDKKFKKKSFFALFPLLTNLRDWCIMKETGTI